MKNILIIMMFFIYTGCENKKSEINLNKSFCLNNEDKAIKLAEKEWLKIFGKDIYETIPFESVLKDDSIWVIYGTLPKNHVGGTPYAEINAKNCEILKMTHTK
ncbi:NTF2 fold immunity protein [uncultured Chryseobacterium sp.]|uniref:NTF2 fold immunity protein n=1 Tax=uncultured Chryseobacterium sp. TaxID=259322 RepID=UPI0025DD16D4|nr:NTF2 fold immunity protein [uncultured Chryseobacterium sp.]